MTRTDLIMFLKSNGYSERSLRILSFEELKRITILQIALNWGEIELTPKI